MLEKYIGSVNFFMVQLKFGSEKNESIWLMLKNKSENELKKMSEYI